MGAIRAAVLTVSDKGAAGERRDTSGPLVAEALSEIGAVVAHLEIVPDEQSLIEQALKRCADEMGLDLVVTTGGTGVAPRDITPEATRAVLQREIPGMAEAMRLESLRKTPHAMISRALAGIRGQCLILNLPGSPKAAQENLRAVLPALPHAIAKIKGDPSDCAQ